MVLVEMPKIVAFVLVLTFLCHLGATFFILIRQKQFDQRLGDLTRQSNGIAARESQYEGEVARLELRRKALEGMIQRNESKQSELERKVARAERTVAENQDQMMKLTNLTVRARVMLRDFIAGLRDDENTALEGIEDTLEGPE